jgi:hypothetical protein
MASRYRDLREFIAGLEERGELRRIRAEVDPYLEMTEIADRTLRAGGPALLFENPRGHDIPVLANLFGTEQRVALGMGAENVEALREIGELLAYLRQPDPPKGLRDAWDKAPLLKKVLDMGPKLVRNPPAHQRVYQGDDVDLRALPIQTCWPGDAAPLVTWPLVITRGPNKARQNLGIYRMQLLGRNKLIMRWLSHRGGALDYRDWQLNRTPASATPSPSPSAPTRPPPSAPSPPYPTRSPSTPSPACCAAPKPSSRVHHSPVPRQQPAGAGHGGDHPRGLPGARRGGGRGALRRSHGLLQRGRALPRVHGGDHQPPARRRSTTAPTRDGHRTSRRYSALPSTRCSCRC